jgi:hypothetical protein
LTVENPTNLYLSITDNWDWFRLGEGFGVKRVLSGDKDFDKHLKVKTHSVDFVTSLISSSAFRRKWQFVQSFDVELQDCTLEFITVGAHHDTEYLLSVLDLLSDLARRIAVLKNTNSTEKID